MAAYVKKETRWTHRTVDGKKVYTLKKPKKSNMAAYVKNKDLYNEMVRCKDCSLNYSNELHGMFRLMVDKFSWAFSYKYQEDREDCKSQAIEDLYLYWHNFDPSKGTNAFAYVTQIIKNGYAKGYRKIYPGFMPSSSKIGLGNIYNL